MSDNLMAFLTETTCGMNCWMAREEVCRCSCGGRNHGCLLKEGGEQPTRQRKIDGFFYELGAVGTRSEMESKGIEINKAAGAKKVVGTYEYKWYLTDVGAPARVKPATRKEIENWPELTAFKDCTANSWAWYQKRPYLLWIKTEPPLLAERKEGECTHVHAQIKPTEIKEEW